MYYALTRSPNCIDIGKGAAFFFLSSVSPGSAPPLLHCTVRGKAVNAPNFCTISFPISLNMPLAQPLTPKFRLIQKSTLPIRLRSDRRRLRLLGRLSERRVRVGGRRLPSRRVRRNGAPRAAAARPRRGVRLPPLRRRRDAAPQLGRPAPRGRRRRSGRSDRVPGALRGRRPANVWRLAGRNHQNHVVCKKKAASSSQLIRNSPKSR